jgi:hypothetical protein
LQKTWADTRGAAAADLKKLEDAILSEYGEAPEIGVLRQHVRKLDAVLDTLGTDMADLFGSAPGAAPADRAKLHDSAKALAGRYRSYIDSDPLLAELDDNPFTSISVKRRFAEALGTIETALSA